MLTLDAALQSLADDPYWSGVIALAGRGDERAVVELADKVRKVRTQKGSERYGLPIGSPIVKKPRGGKKPAASGGSGGGEKRATPSSGDGGGSGSTTGSGAAASSATSPAAGGARGKKAPAEVLGKRLAHLSPGLGDDGRPDLSRPHGLAAALALSKKIGPTTKGDPQLHAVARAMQMAAVTKHPHLAYRRDDGTIVATSKRTGAPTDRPYVEVDPRGRATNVRPDGSRTPVSHDAVRRAVEANIDDQSRGDTDAAPSPSAPEKPTPKPTTEKPAEEAAPSPQRQRAREQIARQRDTEYEDRVRALQEENQRQARTPQQRAVLEKAARQREAAARTRREANDRERAEREARSAANMGADPDAELADAGMWGTKPGPSEPLPPPPPAPAAASPSGTPASEKWSVDREREQWATEERVRAANADVKLPRDDQRLVGRYTTSDGYQAVNGVLRGGQGDEQARADAAKLPDLIAQFTVPEDVTVLRAVEGGDWLPSGDLTGQTLTEPGAMSTSFSGGIGKGAADTVFEIRVPAGSTAMHVPSAVRYTRGTGEHELILPPGTRLQIETDGQALHRDKPVRWITASVVPAAAPSPAPAAAPRPAPFTPAQAARGRARAAERRQGREDPDEADERAARPAREARYDEEADQWRREAAALGANPTEAQVAELEARGWDDSQMMRLNRARRDLGLEPVGRESVRMRPASDGEGTVRDEVARTRAGKARGAVLESLSAEDLDEIEKVEQRENEQRGRGSNAPSDRKRRSAYEKRERIIRDVRAERDRRAEVGGDTSPTVDDDAPATEGADDGTPPALRELMGKARALTNPEVARAVRLADQLLAGNDVQQVADMVGAERAAAARRVGEFASLVGRNAPGATYGDGRDYSADVSALARALERDPRGPDDGYTRLDDVMASARAARTESVRQSVETASLEKLEAWDRILSAHGDGGQFEDDEQPSRMYRLQGYVREVADRRRGERSDSDRREQERAARRDEQQRERAAEQAQREQQRAEQQRAEEEARAARQAEFEQEQADRAATQEQRDAARAERARPRVRVTSQVQRDVANMVMGDDPASGPADRERGAEFDDRGNLVITDPERLALELDVAAERAADDKQYATFGSREQQRARQRGDAARRWGEQVRAQLPVDDDAVSPQARERVRDMSDGELEDAMGSDDHDMVAAAVAEDGRREELRERRETWDERARRFDELVRAGWHEEEANDEVYNSTSEEFDRRNVEQRLRNEGYRGTFNQMARASFLDEIDRVKQLDMEQVGEITGNYTNRAGTARGFTDTDMLIGPKADAVRFASEELKTYWRRNGRLTFPEHKARLLGEDRRADEIAATARAPFE